MQSLPLIGLEGWNTSDRSSSVKESAECINNIGFHTANQHPRQDNFVFARESGRSRRPFPSAVTSYSAVTAPPRQIRWPRRTSQTCLARHAVTAPRAACYGLRAPGLRMGGKSIIMMRCKRKHLMVADLNSNAATARSSHSFFTTLLIDSHSDRI